MLIDSSRSALLVIDVQQKLLPAVYESESVERAVCDLVEVAKELKIATLYSEQYPQGLGPSTQSVLKALPDSAIRLEKLSFSCSAEPDCTEQLEALAPQVIICGMETHVCVLQTAIEMKLSGKAVFVVADAVSSRTAENKQLGLERMRQLGIEIVSKEMVIFEWLRRAGTDAFRSISKAYLR
ncbi:MAG TPA: isochorismatase family protein [Marinobacterium sp.]|nr:isochorismatase family protein [Marinobacterium sp.]